MLIVLAVGAFEDALEGGAKAAPPRLGDEDRGAGGDEQEFADVERMEETAVAFDQDGGEVHGDRDRCDRRDRLVGQRVAQSAPQGLERRPRTPGPEPQDEGESKGDDDDRQDGRPRHRTHGRQSERDDDDLRRGEDVDREEEPDRGAEAEAAPYEGGGRDDEREHAGQDERAHADPELLAKTEGTLSRGYKLLTGYESKEKGYEWFGEHPGHEALTAYGLMEFKDMSLVWSDVDAAMVERTADWLMKRRDGKGGYQRNSRALDSFGRASELTTNLYITWALSEAGPGCLTQPVSQNMTRRVVTCQETDTLDELMAMMTARRFRHLPVVTDGALVGIISIGDVVKHHVAEIEMEATAMREYIAHS